MIGIIDNLRCHVSKYLDPFAREMRRHKRTMTTRPYQGYPYTNPHVTDAPTVDAATASRWNNLPRRPVVPPTGPPRNGSYDQPNDTSNKKPEPDPVIYIDLPDQSCNGVTGPASSEQHCHQDGSSNRSVKMPDPEPVIYIDVPEGGTSDVTGPATPESDPEYVQETIFYDPFENRRIDRQKAAGSPDPEGSRPQRPPRPVPPRTLDLPEPSCSSGYGSSSGLPSSLSKETSLYGQSDEFRSPTGTPYPEPPPAYTEINTPNTFTSTPHAVATPQTPLPQGTEPPRTVVITQGSELNRPPIHVASPIGLASANRKVVQCHHCGLRVHTLVIWENGPITHAIAFSLLCFMLIPLIVLVYCTNFCKYRNHYCPNCNHKIGYEIPGLCVNMTYTSASGH